MNAIGFRLSFPFNKVMLSCVKLVYYVRGLRTVWGYFRDSHARWLGPSPRNFRTFGMRTKRIRQTSSWHLGESVVDVLRITDHRL